MKYSLTVGTKRIRDIQHPKPNEIDLDEIEVRLKCIHRFSNNPKALTVHQHRHLVAALAKDGGASEPVIDWCLHHDDHEAIIGDIPGPLKALIHQRTSELIKIEWGLDNAICMARTGHPSPGTEIRKKVHIFDKMAETIEWIHVLGRDPEGWNAVVPFFDSKVKNILANAKAEAHRS